MKPVPAPLPEDKTRTDVSKSRLRKHAIRKKILRDARQASRGYIVAFSVPSSGE